MSMSSSVVGYRPLDTKSLSMLAVYVSCEEAGVAIPDCVQKFFEYENPVGQLGSRVDLSCCCVEFQDTKALLEGYTIDLKKLPEGVRYIRFTNSF